VLPIINFHKIALVFKSCKLVLVSFDKLYLLKLKTDVTDVFSEQHANTPLQ